jgi:hypothetical protein
METNISNSLRCITLLSMMSEGREIVVTDIIRASMVPAGTPARYSASAIGMVPKMSISLRII